MARAKPAHSGVVNDAMRPTFSSLRALRTGHALCALLALHGCDHGGQAGDDGSPRPDAGPAPRDGGGGGGPIPVDAGPPPQFEIIYRATLDSEVELICAAGLPAEGGMDDVARALAATHHCEGVEGRWQCTCDGAEPARSYAATCVGALQERCGAQAQALLGRDVAPLAECVASLASRDGKCGKPLGDAFECKCGGRDVPIARDDATCEQALWGACAQPCSGADGTCTPHAGGKSGDYECACASAPGTARPVAAATCEEALVAGCDLTTESYDGCNGYGGYCDRKDAETLRCVCADASEHAVAIGLDDRYAPCRTALEQTCGTGDPGPEKLCLADANGYAARCTQPPGDDAPYTCECVLHGAQRDALATIEQVTTGPCARALVATCPQTEPVGEADRARACDYYARCDTHYVGFELDACQASAPDPCVACTSHELDRLELDTEGCPTSGRAACQDACTELVPKAAAVSACEAGLDSMGKLDGQGQCLCDRCHPTFGECMADAGCVEIVDCANATGCDQQSCSSDPTCGPIVTRYQGTHSLGLALQLGQCSALADCAALAGQTP